MWDEPTTYASSADGEQATFANTVTHEWNHGLGEIVTALLTHGFEITGLVEHRTIPYRPLGDQMEPDPEIPGEYRLVEGRERLPLTYILQATLREPRS